MHPYALLNVPMWIRRGLSTPKCSAVPPPRALPEHTVFVPRPFDLERRVAPVARLLDGT